MVHQKSFENGTNRREDSEAFLRKRGIFPANGGFTEAQLARELTRRGWRWSREAAGVEATKTLTATGSVSTRIVSEEPDRTAGLAAVLVEAIRFDDRQGLLLVGPIEADIVVRAPDQRVVAIGEVKGGQSLSAELAVEYRDNLIGHSNVFELAPFFLFVWRDAGYLWDQRPGTYPNAKPTLAFAMTPIVAHYLPWLREDERPGSRELSLAVAHWLDDLAHPVPGLSVPAIDTFAGTDFLDVIQGASVLTDAAA